MSKVSPAHSPTASPAVDLEPTVPVDDLLSAERNFSDNAVTRSSAACLDGVVIGTFIDRDDAGQILVDFPGNPTSAPLAAQTTIKLDADQRNREVALMFQQGDPQRPLVMGLIQNPQIEVSLSSRTSKETTDSPLASLQAEVDNERIVFKADKEIVLKCGKASITLTRAGKILIRGAYLLNRSSGVNRIKGGSVQIN